MNRTGFVTAVFLAVLGCSAFAETSVTNVIARQRWPWSGAVDIDYTLIGDPSDVEVTATWEGQDDPVDLSMSVVGRVSAVERGDHHLIWDPAASGVENLPLRGFRVSVKPIDGCTDRKYLVVDLVNGGSTFMSEPPADGWTNAEYRVSKMVFVRISAGTYPLGLTEDQKNAVWPDGGKYADIASSQKAATFRRVKVSKDYYLAIFMATGAQVGRLGDKSGSSQAADYQSQETIRGPYGTLFSGGEGYSWPETGYDVAPTSIVAQLRAKAKLPTGWIADLPTAAQWEIAARCGKSSFFPNESIKPESPAETVSNYLSRVAWWKGYQVANDPLGATYRNDNVPVGLREANPWGLYDMIGMRAEWVIDWNDNNFTPTDATDPIGPKPNANRNRAKRASDISPSLDSGWTRYYLPARAGQFGKQTDTGCFRFCINTRSLLETTSDAIPTP